MIAMDRNEVRGAGWGGGDETVVSTIVNSEFIFGGFVPTREDYLEENGYIIERDCNGRGTEHIYIGRV